MREYEPLLRMRDEAVDGIGPWVWIAEDKGAVETIKRCKPVIQCELGNDEIQEFLRPFGYEMVATSKADTFYKAV